MDEITREVQSLFQILIEENIGNTKLGGFLRSTLVHWLSQDLEIRAIAKLPVFVCQALEGNPANAIPVIVAWRFLCLSAKLFDDIEDGDCVSNIGEQVNTANGLLFLAHLAIDKLISLDLKTSEALRNYFNQACLTACAGQYLDLSSNHDKIILTPDDWLEAASGKSGSLFAWAAMAGAMVSGATADDLQWMGKYGLHLGILKQISDDVQDFWIEDHHNKTPEYHSCLPACYTAWVLQGQERDDFLMLINSTDKEITPGHNRIRKIVETQGGFQFVSMVARMQYDQALLALRNTTSPTGTISPLRKLLEDTMPCPFTLENNMPGSNEGFKIAPPEIRDPPGHSSSS